MGHNDTGHAAETEDAKGKKIPGCDLYAGLTCEQHQKIMQDVGSGADGMPKIEIPNGVPNSWLVGPDGTVEAIEPAKQQSAGAVQELAEALQKKVGKVVAWKDFEKLQEGFEAGAKATEAGEFKAAIAAYGAIDKKAAKLPEAFGTRLKTAVEALSAKAVEAFEAVKAVEDAAKRDKDMKALRAKLSAKIGASALPVLADIDAWLKANPAPAPAK